MITYEEFETLVKRIEKRISMFGFEKSPIKNENGVFSFRFKTPPSDRRDGPAFLYISYHEINKKFRIRIRNKSTIIIRTKVTFFRLEKICELISEEIISLGKENKKMRMQLLFQNNMIKEDWKIHLDEIKKRRGLDYDG